MGFVGLESCQKKWLLNSLLSRCLMVIGAGGLALAIALACGRDVGQWHVPNEGGNPGRILNKNAKGRPFHFIICPPLINFLKVQVVTKSITCPRGEFLFVKYLLFC